MGVCPKCGEKIEELNWTESTWTYGILCVAETVGLSYETLDTDYSGDIEYECPKCNQVVAHTESEAKEILMKKKKTWSVS